MLKIHIRIKGLRSFGSAQDKLHNAAMETNAGIFIWKIANFHYPVFCEKVIQRQLR